MPTEKTKEGVMTVDPSSGGTVRSLTGHTLAGVAPQTSVPKVADAAMVDRRKRKKRRKEEIDEPVR